MTEKKRELIKTIAVIPSNLEHIAKTGIINGTLLVEIERVMEAYAAQQSDEIAELKKSVNLLHEAMVTAEKRGHDKAMEEVAQQSKIHKPDVNLEYWQKWLTEHGYQIEFDDDGLWAEDWVQDHKWVDIFDLMMQFAIEQQSKMPTEQPEQLTCDACGCHPSIIVQTPVGRFCKEHAKYF